MTSYSLSLHEIDSVQNSLRNFIPSAIETIIRKVSVSTRLHRHIHTHKTRLALRAGQCHIDSDTLRYIHTHAHTPGTPVWAHSWASVWAHPYLSGHGS